MNDLKPCLLGFAIMPVYQDSIQVRIHDLDELASGFIEYALSERFRFGEMVAQILRSSPWKLPHVDPKYEEFRCVVKRLLRKLESCVCKKGIILNPGCTNAETLFASLQRNLTHGDPLPQGAGTKKYGEMYETARCGLSEFRKWAVTQIRDRLVYNREYMMTHDGARVTIPGLEINPKTSPLVNKYVDVVCPSRVEGK